MAQARRALLPRRLTLVIAVVLIGAGLVWFTSRSQAAWIGTLRPLFHFSHWIRPSQESHNLAELQHERDQLRTQVEALSQAVAARDQELSLSRHLDQLADVQASIHRQLIRSPIIGMNPDSGIQSLVIGRGTKDGIRLGQAVLSPGGTVVAKIISAHDHLATALMLTDSQSALAARLASNDRSPAVIHGKRGLSLQVDFLPKTAHVSSGDVVVTAGTELNIPSGLVIGTIGRITTRPGDVFQTATLQSPIDVNELDIVGVVQL